MARKRGEKANTEANTEINTETIIDTNLIPDGLVPSGSTLLNCAMTDNPFGGYRKGTVTNLIGDSSSGKTIAALTSFASMNYFGITNYKLIHDDVEQGRGFNISEMFGEAIAEKLDAPGYDKDGEPIQSDTIEDFEMFLDNHIKEGTPFFYVLDSFDSLDCEADQKKAEEQIKDRKKGNEVTGSYGAAKARKSSELLRRIKMKLKNTNSILIIISQIRDNMNAGVFESKKTRSGGRALKHYSWQEIWLNLGKKHKSKELEIGVQTIAKLGKNRETGKRRQAEFPIFYDLGIDDVTANVEFLVKNEYFKKSKQTLYIPEFEFEGTKQKLVEFVEKNDKEIDLAKMVGDCWNQIEDSVKLHNRKKRFN